MNLVGAAVGIKLGEAEGRMLGFFDGVEDGEVLGTVEGDPLGFTDGIFEGVLDGA